MIESNRTSFVPVQDGLERNGRNRRRTHLSGAGCERCAR